MGSCSDILYFSWFWIALWTSLISNCLHWNDSWFESNKRCTYMIQANIKLLLRQKPWQGQSHHQTTNQICPSFKIFNWLCRNIPKISKGKCHNIILSILKLDLNWLRWYILMSYPFSTIHFKERFRDSNQMSYLSPLLTSYGTFLLKNVRLV